MGSVYLAEHVVIEKKLVLKVLAPDLARREDLVARFLQEARSASRIGHENVIDISRFRSICRGLRLHRMEYLEGKDLGERGAGRRGAGLGARARHRDADLPALARGRMEKNIVHRDMKPENIFLVHREGRPEFVKILDFGIAQGHGPRPKRPASDPHRNGFLAPPSTWRPSRPKARKPTTAPTSTRSAASLTT